MYDLAYRCQGCFDLLIEFLHRFAHNAVKIATLDCDRCHFLDFFAANQRIAVVEAFISTEIDMRDALASLEVIGFNPVQEVAPCRHFDRNGDLTIVDLYIHVLICPFTTRTSFSKNGLCSNAASTRVAALTLPFRK